MVSSARACESTSWWLVIQAAADEVLDDGVGVRSGSRYADMAGAAPGDGPVGDAGVR
jgi:hypothetical protein